MTQGVVKLLVLIIIFSWVYLGSLAWQDYRLIEQINSEQSNTSQIVSIPFFVESAREQVNEKLSKANPDISHLEQKILKNIENRPLYAYSWLDLANLKYYQDDEKLLNFYINQAQNLWPTASYSLYLIGSFWFKIGENEKAIKAFNQYLYTRPKELASILNIIRIIQRNRGTLVDLIFDSEYGDSEYKHVLAERIMNYALRNKDLDLTNSIWNKMNGSLIDNDELVQKYLNNLILNNEIEAAIVVAQQYFPGIEIKETILNAGFESEIIDGGFHWNFREHNSVNHSIDTEISFEGENSLKIEFTGGENVDYQHVKQIIPVEPGTTYKVTAYWRAQGITTRTTPYIELAAMNSSYRAVTRSESKRGNWSWKEVEMEIDIPDDSNLMRIMIKRDKTSALDKNIEGQLWIDDFKIEKSYK